MSSQFEAAHPRDAGSGRFDTKVHGESGVALVPAVPAEEVIARAFDALESAWAPGHDYVRTTKQAIRAGRTAASDVLADIASWGSGVCSRHQSLDHWGLPTASICEKCRIIMATEAVSQPRPAPVPTGPAPAYRNREPSPSEELDYTFDEERGSSTTTTAMTGDESFETAVRRMLGAPEDAPVTVTDKTTESGDSTREFYTEITVSAGSKTQTFEGLGSLMRELVKTEPEGPMEMALRLMRANNARRPLLTGPAAIYRRQNRTKPEFAHVVQVLPSGSDPRIQVLHLDGRMEFIYLGGIEAIHETDQTEIYEEKGEGETVD